jgi:hypothetical protein
MYIEGEESMNNEVDEYYQQLCERGHETLCDCHIKEETQCRHCGANIVWKNLVHLRDDKEVGYRDLERIEPARYAPPPEVRTDSRCMMRPATPEEIEEDEKIPEFKFEPSTEISDTLDGDDEQPTTPDA